MKKIIIIMFLLIYTLSLRSENYPCDTDDCLDSLGIKWDSLFVTVNVDSLPHMKSLNPAGCYDCKFYVFYRVRYDTSNICPNLGGCEIQISQVWMDGACFIPCTLNGVTYDPYYNMVNYYRIWNEAIRYLAASQIEPCFIPNGDPWPGKEKIVESVKFGSCKQMILNPDSSITIIDCDLTPEVCCVQRIRTQYRDFKNLDAGWTITQSPTDSCDSSIGCKFACINEYDWTPPIINDKKSLINGIDYKIKNNIIELYKAKFEFKVRIYDVNGVQILSKTIIQDDIEEIKIPDDKFPSIIIFSEENGNILKLEKVIE